MSWVGTRIPTLGYPSRTHAVFALHQQGLTTKDIAERIGINVDAASALLRAAKHSMRPTYARAGLSPHASARGISVHELETRLLEIIAQENLVDAILDDRFNDDFDL